MLQKSGEVPPGLKRKCLWMERSRGAAGLAGSLGAHTDLKAEAAVEEACRRA